MSAKPNIVFIFPDQQRGDVVGFAGNPVVKTPNLDRFAAESVSFSRCITNSPVCMPARMSIMSGKHPCQHGMWANNVDGDPEQPNHVRNIRDAGYRTAQVGKVHLHVRTPGDGHSREHAHKMHAWGFDDTHELRDIMAYAVADCYYTDFLCEKGTLEPFRNYMRLIVRGENQGTLLPWETPPSALPDEQSLDMYTANRAVKWIEEYDDDTPFYLQVMFPGPHNPFDSSAADRALYDPEDMPLSIVAPTEGPVSRQVERSRKSGGLAHMTPSQDRLMRLYYYAKVTHIDRCIGLVLGALEKRGVLDDTWVIYTSDHGEMLGDHRCRNKALFYEGALTVPLCIRPPGGVTGWRTSALTDHLDVVETMLEIVDAATLDGEELRSSLVSKIANGAAAEDAHVGKDVAFSEVRLFSMVRSDQYKLTVDSLTREPLELYDMASDPEELKNLVDDPALEGVRKDLIEGHLNGLLDRLDHEKVQKYQSTLKTNPNRGGWRAIEQAA